MSARLLPLLLLGSASLAEAQWDVPVTEYRLDDQLLDVLADEPGHLRVPRLALGAAFFAPLRDNDQDTFSLGGHGSLAIEVPLGVRFTVAGYARGGMWREGGDLDEETRKHVMLDVGGRARARFSASFLTFFLGGHGGYSRDWAVTNDARTHGWHAGAHAGFRTGRAAAFEVEVGFNHRAMSDRRWFDPYLQIGVAFTLRRIR